MFRGQKYYVEKMLPNKMKPLVSTDFNMVLQWLHNNFNKCFMYSNKNYAGGFFYASKGCGPSDYKKKKALTYLHVYGMYDLPGDIFEGSLVYMKCAAIFYYAAKVVKHYFQEECDIWLGDTNATIRQTIDTNMARLRKDHYLCIESKAKKIAALTAELSAEYKRLEELTKDQPNVIHKYIEKGVQEYAKSKNM